MLFARTVGCDQIIPEVKGDAGALYGVCSTQRNLACPRALLGFTVAFDVYLCLKWWLACRNIVILVPIYVSKVEIAELWTLEGTFGLQQVGLS